MRLDIGLMHRLRRVAALDHQFRLAEPGLGVALREADALGDVRRGGGLGLDAGGIEVVVQQGRVRRHRGLDVDDVGQHLVLDLDEIDRLGGDEGRGGRDRGHGVPLVEHLVAGHDIAREVAEIHRPLADEGLFRADLGEIGRGHDGAHAG